MTMKISSRCFSSATRISSPETRSIRKLRVVGLWSTGKWARLVKSAIKDKNVGMAQRIVEEVWSRIESRDDIGDQIKIGNYRKSESTFGIKL